MNLLMYEGFEPFNPMKDKQEYQGYSIRLMLSLPAPGSMGSYDFDILKDNKALVHQFQNPVALFTRRDKKRRCIYNCQWDNKKTHGAVPKHTALLIGDS